MQFKAYASTILLAMALPACLAAPLPVGSNNIDRSPAEVLEKPENCLVWDEKLGTCKEWANKPAAAVEQNAAPKPKKKLSCEDCFPFWTLSIL